MRNNDDNFNFIYKYKRFAIFALIFVVWLYALITYTYNVEEIKINSDFGSIGDFIGGLLNPIFALLGLFALLTTIRIQVEELKSTNKALETSHTELALTREQTTMSRTALQEQSASIKLQNFENTFFNMLNLHNEIIKSLKIEKDLYISINDKIDNKEIVYGAEFKSEKNGKEAFVAIGETLWKYLMEYNTKAEYQRDIDGIKSENRNQANATNELYLLFHYEFQQYYAHYFRNIYQILKFISQSKVDNQKFYSNILRAQLSRLELEFLFYHCSSDIWIEHFLPLLIEFEFMEPFPHDTSINKIDILKCIRTTKKMRMEYPITKLFGKNEAWEDTVYNVMEEVIQKMENKTNPQ